MFKKKSLESISVDSIGFSHPIVAVNAVLTLHGRSSYQSIIQESSYIYSFCAIENQTRLSYLDECLCSFEETYWRQIIAISCPLCISLQVNPN